MNLICSPPDNRLVFASLIALLLSAILIMSTGTFATIVDGQQQQQSQQQNQRVPISIVPGSSSQTNDAYEPNSVIVTTGAAVKWTNDDSVPHTGTSGEDGTPDGRFDSGIMAPAETFEYTFTEAGEHPYF